MLHLRPYHKLFAALLLSLVCFCTSARAQNWQWAKAPTCGSVQGGSEGWLVKNDASNHVYVAGYYYGSHICFGNYTFYNPVNAANTTQTIVIKYDSSGNILWANASTSGQSKPMGIAATPTGELVVFGVFTTDTIRFGSTTLTNPAFDTTDPIKNNAFYLLKYDANGNIVWAKSGTNIHPTANALHPGAIAIDRENNSYITSTYNTSSFSIGNDTVYNFGSTNSTNDIFLAKYNSDGALVWLKSFGGLKDDYAGDIAISNSDKLYLAGFFNSGFIKFGSTTLYSQVEKAFVARLDTAGRSIWAKAANTKSRAEAIAVDRNESVYIAGGYRDTVSFDDYFYNYPNGGYYLLKFDTFGTIQQGKAIYFKEPVTPCCNAYGLTTDRCSNVWLSANMSKSAAIALDSTTSVNAPTGSTDPMFVAGYNSNGNLIDYATLKSGAGNNTGLSNTGLSADTSGNIYLSGDYRVQNPFVVGNDSLYINNGAIATLFVAKYKPKNTCDTATPPPPVYPDIPVITITPNPAAYECVLNYNGSLGAGTGNVVIRDITGRLIATYPILSQHTILPLSYLAQGVYTCIIKVAAHPDYTILLAVVK